MMVWPFPDDGPFDPASRRLRRADNPDVRLTYQVADQLLADPRIGRQPITVEVQNRVVLLSGTVDCAEAKQAAGDTARRISDVYDVQNGLRVHPGEPPASPPGAPHTGPARNGADTVDGGRQFDDIVAALTTDDPTLATRVRAPRRRVTLAVLFLLAALSWAVLSMLMVRHGWIGVLITCAVGATALAIGYGRRPGRRHPNTPAGRKT